MKFIAIFLVLSIVLVVGTTTFAESVFVTSFNGEQGHAWLFGSSGQTANECWLAVPLHVISADDGIPKSFVFTDKFGSSGQSGEPLSVGAIPGAVDSAGGVTDLAFAHVEVGRSKGDCMSRLGLPKYSYDSLMRTVPTVIISSMLPTSYGIFEAQITRVGTKTGGGLVEIQPASEKNAKLYVRQGISGSVAEIMRGEETQPFAMVLKADPDKGTLRALRFDLINSAFHQVEAHFANLRRAKRANTVGVPYNIVEFKGISVDPTIGPTSLYDPQKCWTIAPQGGQKSVSITIELSDPHDRIAGITLLQGLNCGNPPQQFFVDQRVSETADWNRAATCSTLSGKIKNDSSACMIDLRGPRQLRISFIDRRPINILNLILR